jgi:4-alpha-glucanotransferase
MMKIYFNIEYRTVYGEELYVNVSFHNAKGLLKNDTFKMSTLDGNNWNTGISVADKQLSFIDYYYSVNKNGTEERHEWLVVQHRLEIVSPKATSYTTTDLWRDNPENSYLYSSAFTDCLAARKISMSNASDYVHTLRIKVRAPQLRRGERLAIIGDDAALGAWIALRALPMVEHHYNEWVATIDADKVKSPFVEFKFVILNEEKDVTPLWENGSNRTLEIPRLNDHEVIVREYAEASFSIYAWRGAGSVVPVFSLRSKTSFGIGDFGDLKKMITWVSATKQRVLQLLPINDTTITHTWTDSYPYNSISIYALHPQYADLSALPKIKNKALRDKFSKMQKELNALSQIDYERVNNAKMDYLRSLFVQEGDRMMAEKPFKDFFAANKRWLVPYAQYCTLRDKYGTARFNEWPDHHLFDNSERSKLENPSTKEYQEVSIWYFIQYILDTQMREASKFAHDNGVILKGDIPIGISRDSVEAWTEPFYFNLDGQAGAPPDAFSANGQNWGFPTYNWSRMLDDGCSWWVNRFRKMAEYFDAYRIDHILGFFRIWEIPVDAVHGLLGQFSPSLGMTVAEIEGYGLHFQEQLFTEPFITDWCINETFGKWAETVRTKYLEHTHDDMYRLLPAYDTQRKVEAAFKDKTSDDDVWIRDGLYALISNVLFLHDHHNPSLYHPRISAQFSFVFRALYDHDKAAFNKLYNDYFYRRNNQFWYYEAMKKLPKLTQATRMLVCGEDLGMVPDCVPWVMEELRILSLEIQSMPKDPKTRFGHLSRNPYRSVCTISTHDMPTLRQWWKEDHERTQNYYNTMLYRAGDAPADLPGWLAKDIVSRHLTSPSMLCLLSLQDWLSISETYRLPDADAERVNIPSNPRHYWRYRMHLNIEDLMKAESLNDDIRSLIVASGRK